VASKRVLLIIGGGIAAYKCLELARRLGERGIGVRAVMTKAAQAFITPLSVGAITRERVFTDLFSLEEERDIGHIRLSREADLVVVAPATADLLAKMAGGHADDLASAVLLATDKPVLAAPAMNPRMWQHPATRRNVSQLKADGVHFVGPNVGEMAEPDEAGPGRMAEPLEIAAEIEELLEGRRSHPLRRRADPVRRADRSEFGQRRPLEGRHVLVTSGPTYEPIDPVRYIANRSSGRQGHAIAAAAARAGARVTLVSGPVALPQPAGVTVLKVETANEMLAAALGALPADIAICAAAVADWRVAQAATAKIKKAGSGAPKLTLVENPDILKRLAAGGKDRPVLVIGFAAETENVVQQAKRKLKAKGCDWIVANDVSAASGVMGGERNQVHLVTPQGVESWPEMDKSAVAERLIARAAERLAQRAADA